MEFRILVIFALFCVSSAFEECGQKGGGSRIIGGKDAAHGEFPWQISLRYNGGRRFRHICGGTLINSEWVVSAAHCFNHNKDPKRFMIRVGDWHRLSEDGTESDLEVDSIYVHGGWNIPKRLYNDIALVKLAKKADLSGPYVGPACIPPKGKDYRDHKNCFLSGWGLIEPPLSDKLADNLQKAEGTIWGREALRKVWGSALPPNAIGFGVPKGPDYWSACMGDSGGPLVCPNGAGAYDLVGIVSFGPGFCRNQPGVFTEVAAYSDWIKFKTGGGGGSASGEAACDAAGKFVPHETDCDKYYQCTGDGTGAIGECPGGLKFNKNTSMCDWEANVQC